MSLAASGSNSKLAKMMNFGAGRSFGARGFQIAAACSECGAKRVGCDNAGRSATGRAAARFAATDAEGRRQGGRANARGGDRATDSG